MYERCKGKISAILAGLLVSACAVGPDYQPPQTASANAQGFVTQVAGTDPATELPDNWWQLYNDPVLDGLIARAFAANTDLRAATANLARAQAVLGEARAGRLPSTTISGGATYGDAMQQGGFGGSSNDAQWTGNGTLGVAWEVDLFGRVGRAIEAARADAAAVQAARDAVRVTVAAEVTRSYFNACSFTYALDVATESAKASEESYQLVNLQKRVGSAGKLDAERAGASAATARAAIPALEGERQVALYELAALLGTTPDNIPVGAQQCSLPPEPVAAIPVGDGAALLRRRPDLRAAERRLAADTARIGVATADLYPRISLGGSGNFFRSGAVQGNDSLSFSLGPLISWSFPNISVARARIKQAKAQGEASLALFDGTVLTALKEVEQALARLDSEQRRLGSLQEAQQRAQEAHRLANLRYRAGSISLLDVLVAQADMLNARAAYAASLRTLASNRVDLFKALGGGWQAPDNAGT